MSGSHTALLSIAMWFARRGWNVSLASNVAADAQPLLPNLRYLRAGFRSSNCDTKPYDFALIPNIWGPATGWDRCSAHTVVIIMENQLLDGPSCGRLASYLTDQQAAMNGTKPELAFLHLSPWGLEIFRKNAAGAAVIDRSIPGHHSMKLRMGWRCKFTLDAHVEHDAITFRNPIPLDLIDEAGKRAGPRNERSLIFPACQERGGVVAASVFRVLQRGWGANARTTYAFYDKATSDSDELRAIRKAAGEGPAGEAVDPRVSARIMSKPDLLQAMHEAG